MHTILLFILVSSGVIPHQEISPSMAIYQQAENVQTQKYTFDERYDYLILGSEFSKDIIQNIQYTDRRIIRIDLIYTAYRESTDFSQKELNLNRLKNLIRINPAIIDNTFFDWRLIEQTGCNSSTACKGFFHGFIIYYDAYYTKEETIGEIDSIRNDLTQLETTIEQNKSLLTLTSSQIDCEYPSMRYSEEYLSEELEKIYKCSENFKGKVYFDAIMDYKGRVLDIEVKGSLFPCKERLAAALNYILQWKNGLIIGRLQYGLTTSGLVDFPLNKRSVKVNQFSIADSLINQYQILAQNTRCTAYQVDTAYSLFLPKVVKKEVSSVLFRNQWNEKLIVVDVTGSMFPYTADLLKWIRLGALTEEKTFVFFNDGDDKATSQKKIGKTGGLYLVRSQHFEEVKETMFEAMRNGGGGDLRENNCEALRYGMSKSGFPTSAIMIADNNSFPRDYQLLEQYKGSLKIILCGTDKGINTQYLDLARKYRFTIHTLHADLQNLYTINPGQRIELDGQTYSFTTAGFQHTNPIR